MAKKDLSLELAHFPVVVLAVVGLIAVALILLSQAELRADPSFSEPGNLVGFAYESRGAVPDGFAPPITLGNLLFLRADQQRMGSSLDLDVVADDGTGKMLFYRTFHVYQKDTDSWKAYYFDEEPDFDGKWILGGASKSVRLQSSVVGDEGWVLVFACERIDDAWKCGCDDEECGLWNIQSFSPPLLCDHEPGCVDLAVNETFCQSANMSRLYSCVLGADGCLDKASVACAGGKTCGKGGDDLFACVTCSAAAPAPGEVACGENQTVTLCAGGTETVNGTLCESGTGQCIANQCRRIWYRDVDGDGFGNPLVNSTAATQPSGYVLDHSDCNDNDPLVNPDAIEVCDAKDNDCKDGVDVKTNICNDLLKTCTAGQCVTTCTGCSIGGSCYASGATNPSNSCQVCTPSSSSSSWSTKTAGSTCTIGGQPGTCSGTTCVPTPTCTDKCVVDGGSYCGSSRSSWDVACQPGCESGYSQIKTCVLNPSTGCTEYEFQMCASPTDECVDPNVVGLARCVKGCDAANQNEVITLSGSKFYCDAYWKPCDRAGAPACPTVQTQSCGNGVKEGTEECDLGSSNNGVCPSTCSATCTTNTCAGAVCSYDSTTDFVASTTLTCSQCQGTPYPIKLSSWSDVSWYDKYYAACCDDSTDCVGPDKLCYDEGLLSGSPTWLCANNDLKDCSSSRAGISVVIGTTTYRCVDNEWRTDTMTQTPDNNQSMCTSAGGDWYGSKLDRWGSAPDSGKNCCGNSGAPSEYDLVHKAAWVFSAWTSPTITSSTSACCDQATDCVTGATGDAACANTGTTDASGAILCDDAVHYNCEAGGACKSRGDQTCVLKNQNYVWVPKSEGDLLCSTSCPYGKDKLIFNGGSGGTNWATSVQDSRTSEVCCDQYDCSDGSVCRSQGIATHLTPDNWACAWRDNRGTWFKCDANNAGETLSSDSGAKYCCDGTKFTIGECDCTAPSCNYFSGCKAETSETGNMDICINGAWKSCGSSTYGTTTQSTSGQRFKCGYGEGFGEYDWVPCGGTSQPAC